MSGTPGTARATDGTQGGELLAADCCRWVAQRFAGRRDSGASAWTTHLQPGGMVFRTCGPAMARGLTQNLQITVQLAGILQREPPLDSRPSYLRWLQQAIVLRAAWPPVDGLAWESLLLRGPAEGETLVRAIVARAVQAAVVAANVPASVLEGIAPLLRNDLRFSDDVALPPSELAPTTIGDYLLGADDRKRLSNASRVLQEVCAIRNRLQPPRAAAHSTFKLLQHELPAALTGLEKLLLLGAGGWPVIQSQLLFSQVRLAELLERLADASDRPSTVGQMQLREWSAALKPAALAGPAANQRVAHADWHDKTNGPAVAASPLLTLCNEVKALAVSSDECFRQFASRLYWLHAVCSEGASNAAALSFEEGRNLLTSLIYLDEQAQGSGMENWAAVRSALRAVVEQLNRFVILDEQLVGQSFDDVAQQVVAVGHVVTNRVAPGRIGEVRQPGYALRGDNSPVELICPARVLVARKGTD